MFMNNPWIMAPTNHHTLTQELLPLSDVNFLERSRCNTVGKRGIGLGEILPCIMSLLKVKRIIKDPTRAPAAIRLEINQKYTDWRLITSWWGRILSYFYVFLGWFVSGGYQRLSAIYYRSDIDTKMLWNAWWVYSRRSKTSTTVFETGPHISQIQTAKCCANCKPSKV